MKKEKVDKLDVFEANLNKATLEPGSVKIGPSEWQSMYSLSLSFNNYEEQEKLDEYIRKKLKDFTNYWSSRLEDVSSLNERLIEEFSLFWSSTQLYIYTKQSIFAKFFETFSQENFAPIAFRDFTTDFFKRNIPRISNTLIHLINQDRLDIKVPRTEMIKVIQMIQEIGFEDNISLKKVGDNLIYCPKEGKREDERYLKYYKTYFQGPLIEDLKKFYTTESARWFEMTSVEYCRVANRHYGEELKRALDTYYLSKHEVDNNLNAILITKYYEELCTSTSGIVSIIKKVDPENINQSFKDLGEIYNFFKRGVKSIHDYTPPMKKIAQVIHAYITEEIKAMVAKDNKDAQSSVLIINEIVKLYKIMKEFLEKSMANDLLITNDVENAFLFSINEDKAFPIRFAEWANDQLSLPEDARANNSNIIDDFVTLSRKIYDKDIFLKRSKEFLAARLLQEKPNIDQEKVFWGKMGTEWGLGDLNQMHSMMDDIKLGEEFCNSWKKYLSSKNPEQKEFVMESIKILRESSWPQKMLVKDKAIFKKSFNPELAKMVQTFEDYYIKAGNNGKVLDWMLNQGNATLITNSNGKKYFLTSTIPQMGVLLLMNDSPSMSLLEIKAKLGLDDKTKRFAMEAVRGLVRFAVITWTRNGNPVDDKDKKEVPQDEDVFTVAKTFKAPKLSINMIPKLVVKRDDENKNNAEDDMTKERSFVIDATVVRVMKSKRELSLINLQQEVKKIISLFVPDPKLVKKRIDVLLEQEYMERHPTANNTFIYKP